MLRSERIGHTVVVAALVLVLPLIMFSGCSKKSTTPSNRAPAINSVTVSPQTVSPGGTATVTVSATDPDGDQLTYTYTVSGGTIVPNGPTATWTLPTQAGAYQVNVTVSDGDRAVAGIGGATVTQPTVVTRIVGTLSFAPGQSGNLANTRVAIYTSLTDWANDIPVRFVAPSGSGAVVSYSIDNVVPGNYYGDAWLDFNNNLVIDAGDFFGWYGNGVYPNGSLTPFPINQGETKTINIQMYVL